MTVDSQGNLHMESSTLPGPLSHTMMASDVSEAAATYSADRVAPSAGKPVLRASHLRSSACALLRIRVKNMNGKFGNYGHFKDG